MPASLDSDSCGKSEPYSKNCAVKRSPTLVISIIAHDCMTRSKRCKVQPSQALAKAKVEAYAYHRRYSGQ